MNSKSTAPLDLASATTLVAASMIGVGVYTTSGYTMGALGNAWLVIAAWLVGGLIAICGALGYASLASRFTQSGGEYLFLSRTWHPVAGLMAGWVSLLAGFTGAIAAAALGLEEYLKPMLADVPVPAGSIAVGSVMIASILHTVGVRGAARVQDAIVVFKMLMILAVILLAVAAIGSWAVFDGSETFARPTAEGFDLLTFANQLVYISFSYLGFNAAIYVAGEVRDAEVNVPRAMIAGTALVTVLYVILNAIFVLAPDTATIVDPLNQAQIAAVAASAVGGDGFAMFVRAVIVISLFTSVSALVMTGPRVYAKMADDGFFPERFCFEGAPPVIAIWFQAILAIVAISMATLQNLLGYLGLTLSLCSALTVSMVFVVKRRGEPIWMPAGGIAAAIYIIATVILAILYAIDNPKSAIAAGVTLLAGAMMFPLMKNRSLPTQDPGASETEK